MAGIKTNLREIIKAKRKSQGWVSMKTGIPREYINKIAAGKTEPGVRKALLIARALHVHPDEIWPVA